jgi:hypothetical protein
MTVLNAKRKLQQYGTEGNWRLKGLLLAGLRGSNITSEDMAKAWPRPGKKSDYRFLQHNENSDIDREMNRTAVGEKGTDRHRMLKDFGVNADVPKQLSTTSQGIEESDQRIEARLDDAIPRMLFAASDYEEIDTLFREQLFETIQEGARQEQFAREVGNVINAQTRQGDVPIAEDDEVAEKVAQGAEIRDDREDYTTVAWDCERHGQGARVTDAMRDQAMVDLIERQIQHVGRSVENAINRVYLTSLIDDAQNNFDTEGSDQGVPALNGAYTEVDTDDFKPNTYVTHPEYRGTLFDDSNLVYANRAGSDEILRNREDAPIVGDLMGLDMHAAASDRTYDDGTDDTWPGGSETWGFAADGEKGAAVFDRNHTHIILYNPDGDGMTVKDYEDPIRDLNGVNARTYIDFDYSQARACSTVEY